MNGRAAREIRRAARDASQQTVATVAPVLDAAAQHARFLQGRVEALEMRTGAIVVEQNYVAAVAARSFLGRLKWLFTGR